MCAQRSSQREEIGREGVEAGVGVGAKAGWAGAGAGAGVGVGVGAGAGRGGGGGRTGSDGGPTPPYGLTLGPALGDPNGIRAGDGGVG